MTEVQKRFQALKDRMKFFGIYMKGDEIDMCLSDLEKAITSEKKAEKKLEKEVKVFTVA